jgi:hypothetical protein
MDLKRLALVVGVALLGGVRAQQLPDTLEACRA